jgi:hypothetical protein
VIIPSAPFVVGRTVAAQVARINPGPPQGRGQKTQRPKPPLLGEQQPHVVTPLGESTGDHHVVARPPAFWPNLNDLLKSTNALGYPLPGRAQFRQRQGFGKLVVKLADNSLEVSRAQALGHFLCRRLQVLGVLRAQGRYLSPEGCWRLQPAHQDE